MSIEIVSTAIGPQTEGEFAPDFRCEACGASTGAQRDAGGPWRPQKCHRCESRRLTKEAAARRKLGAVAAGVDIQKAFAAYRKFAPFLGNLGRHIKVQVGHRAEARWSGHAAVYSRSLRVAYGPSATKAEVLEVLVHEMCHLACPRREGHGERFRLTLRRAAKELWGIDVPLLKSSERGVEHNASYAMDRLIMDELEMLVAAGKVEVFPYEAPAAPRRSREALVEQRAAHAARMLARAETRLKRAKTLERKWRLKVNGYERRAAKKG